jgi:hypothetical protein
MKRKPKQAKGRSTTAKMLHHSESGPISLATGEMPTRMSAKDYREQVLGELPQFGEKTAHGQTPDAKPDTKAQIRLAKAREMNANEKRLLAVLEKRHEGCTIRYESMSFRLPSGTLYTPDFIVLRQQTVMAIYEAKDSYLNKSSDASKAKFKEARAAFPEFRWVFAQWNKATGKYLEAE